MASVMATGVRGTPNRWTTLHRLYLALAALTAFAVLFLCVILVGVRQHRDANKTIGKDAAPSIIAAQSIKSSLADMDANVANELMVRHGQNAQSIEGYTQRRNEVGQGLIRAAENITYGEVERRPIQTLQIRLGEYEEWVSRARTLYERNPQDPGSIAAYRQANALLQGTLYPAADALAQANTNVLNRSYAEVQATSRFTMLLIVFVGVLLITTLAATQLFLVRRMNRLVNPPLFAATLLTIWLLVRTVGGLQAADGHLKVAKEDAFDSIRMLWQARAIAYDANTDESRWLLDRERAAEYEKVFFSKTAQLLHVPAGQSYESIASATRAELPSGSTGYFALELHNITFQDEQAAASNMVRTFGVYYGLDQKIRRLENEGKHEEAVAFCISMAPGDSNWAFDRFDKALGKTLEINQREFDHAVADGAADLQGADILGVAGAIGVAALSLLGLRPRLREYTR